MRGQPPAGSREPTRRRAVAPGGKWAAVVLAAALALTALAGPARAQSGATPPDTTPAPAEPPAMGVPPDTVPVQRPAPAAVGWGKWAAAALAAGFTAAGVEQHNNGNAAFRSLITYCGQAVCALAPDGRYADPAAEATYQRVVRADRAARVWLVAGQVTAVGTAVLFVVDLLRQQEPANIPYAGLLLLESGDGVTRVGFRIPLGTQRR